MNLGSTELLILAVIVVVVFGGSWLPKAARNLGRAKVEVDKAQKQIAETKAQVVEATGLDKAEAALKKANRTLNQSPKSLMKNAVTSAGAASVAGSDDPAATAPAASTDDVIDAEIVDQRSDAEPASDSTRNIDFSD